VCRSNVAKNKYVSVELSLGVAHVLSYIFAQLYCKRTSRHDYCRRSGVMELTSTLTLKLTDLLAQDSTIRVTVYYAQINLERQLADTNNENLPLAYIANI
jgi:hypothetical protein